MNEYQYPRLTERIASGEVDLSQLDDLTRNLGGLVVPPTLETIITPVTSGPLNAITARHCAVLFLASHGGTASEVANVLGYERREVTGIRDELYDMCQAKTTAGVVNRAILDGVLPIDDKSDGSAEKIELLSRKDIGVLTLIAEGLTVQEIRARFETGSSLLKRRTRRIFQIIQVGGLTHSVRGSYELGILRKPDTSAEST
jgi:transcriptional regulator